ncbi:MAG: hypothetical protein HY901_06300, partial [Deltaproteobacteria bacterium]|nr:hypothetical protein [Deltaproteobacteria bacterium]
LGGQVLWLAGCPSKVDLCRNATCGETCCQAGQVCNGAGACCTPDPCGQKECGDDGCGSSCGACSQGSRCNLAARLCETCSPETSEGFCARLALSGKVCGLIADSDYCTGEERTEDCGGCDEGSVCTADHRCLCGQKSPEEFCAAAGAACGTYSGMECGQLRTEECGGCPEGECVDHTCLGCVYEGDLVFCERLAALGRRCGSVGARDNCGATRTVECGVGACLAGERCDPTTNGCEPCVAESPALFCQRMAEAGKRCGVVQDEDLCGIARTEDCGDTCSSQGGRACLQNVCVPPGVPANDRCASPELLAFGGGGTVTVTGDTTRAAADEEGTCSPNLSGPDVLYRLEIEGAAPRKVAVKVTAVGTRELAPVVYLRSSCADPSAEVACARGFGAASFEIGRLPPGAYWLVVDSESSAYAGAFDLQVTMGEAEPIPANDSCGGAIPVTGAGGVVAGTTAGATDDSSGRCATPFFPQDGPDVTYSFSVAPGESRSVHARVVAAAGSGLHPVLYLRRDCADADPLLELGCSDYQGEGATELLVGRLEQGEYSLIVDGEERTAGAFQLEVTLSAPVELPDSCQTAKHLLADGSQTLTFTGDTSVATHGSQSAQCQGGNGNDLVYDLELPASQGPKDLHITLVSADPQGLPLLYVRKGSCMDTDPSNEIACDSSSTQGEVSVRLRSAQPDHYFIWVDGLNRNAGPFTLTVQIADPEAPPANDGCGVAGEGAAQVVLDASGHGVVQASTLEAFTSDSDQASCGTATGRDLVYAVDTTGMGERDLKASLTFQSNTNPILYLWAQCDPQAAENELDCAYSWGGTATLLGRRLAEGRYFLWVDQKAGEEGPFELAVDVTVPPASPCSAPVLVDLSTGHAVVDGSTVNTANTTQGLCGGKLGNDAVFQLTLAQRQRLKVLVTPHPDSLDYSPTVYLRGTDCPDEAAAMQLACAKGAVPGDSVALEVKNLAAGTYYLWVDGAVPSQVGDFEVRVDLEAPIFPPGNDTCGPGGANVVALQQGVAYHGSTSDALPDYGAQLSDTCLEQNGDWPAVGPDLVFSFTATTSRLLEVLATPDDWDVSLWISTGVCGGEGSACVYAADGGSRGARETLLLPAVAGTTYYLHIDAWKDLSGPFTLLVQPHQPRTNDQCGVDGANAVALHLGDAPLVGDSTVAVDDYGDLMSPPCYVDTNWCAPGNDLVYLYRPEHDGEFVVEVVPVGWDVYVWYTLDACGGNGMTCVHAADKFSLRGTERLVVPGMAGRRYFIYVDSYGSFPDTMPGGLFTIQVQ